MKEFNFTMFRGGERPGDGRRLKGSLLALVVPCLLVLAVLGGGCGGGEDSRAAQNLSDPAGQLPGHVNWNSYNLYRCEPDPNGQWVQIVSLGTLQEGPAPGDRPVILAHGLGGSIRNDQMLPLAQYLLSQGLASSVFGFEYDSQDGINANAVFYRQALQLLSSFGTPDQNWTLIGHSMGGLVARAALQDGPLPISGTGNRLITLGTPHLGSPVVKALQEASVATQTLVLIQLDQGGFNNSDGNPCETNLYSDGFKDLRIDSVFLANLNVDLGNHPQARVFTIAGTSTGSLQQGNDLLGVTTDDGLVTLDSANPVGIGAAGSGTAPVSHTELDQDAGTVFPLIRAFMTQ